MLPPKIAETFGYITIGAILVYPFLAFNLRVASRFGFIDWPKSRGVSQEQIPIIGYGLVAFVLSVMTLSAYFYDFSPWVLLTAALVALMGHLDDRKPLPALEKLGWQILCVMVVLYFDPNVRSNIGDKYGLLGFVVAGAAIIALVNAINFIDGIDGLAGTVIMMSALGLSALSFGSGSHYSYFMIGTLIGGAIIPFLYMNIAKRKGFLGNIGSYFFGYTLAVMHLSIPMNATDPMARLCINALCFMIPLADSVTVMFSRLLSVRSPFQGDKGHLHHRLVQASLPLRVILFNFGLIAFTGVVIAYLLNEKTGMHYSRLPIVICAAYVGIISLLISMIEMSSKRRLKSYFLRFDAGEPVYFLKYKIQTKNGIPVSNITMRRLEAKISTEIRVYDVCFVHGADELYVILNAMGEPIRAISNRIDPIFQHEKLDATLVLDKGEYVKLSYLEKAAAKASAV